MTEQQQRSFYIKAILLVFLIWIILFELVGRYASGLEYIDVTTKLDKAIPLVSEFVWIYQFCYILPLVIVFIIKDFHRVNLAITSFMMVSLIGFIVYLVFPVGFERPELGGSISDRVLAFQYNIDFQPSANKLPSLHCAMSTILILACRNRCVNKSIEILVSLICVGIVISTLFVKQHIFYDVLSGVFAGGFIWWGLSGFYNKKHLGENLPKTSLLLLQRFLIPVWVALLLGLVLAWILSL